MSSFSLPKKFLVPFLWLVVGVAVWGSLSVGNSRKKAAIGADRDSSTRGEKSGIAAGNPSGISEKAEGRNETESQWRTSFESRTDNAAGSVDYHAWLVDRSRLNPVFEWRGGLAEQAGEGSTAVRRRIGWNEDPNSLAMEFETSAPAWDLLCAPQGSGWRVLTHDVGNSSWQVVGSWKSPKAETILVQAFRNQTGVRKARRWRVEYSNQLALGIRLKETETLVAMPTPPPLKRVVWCGDSFVEGVGADSMWQGFAAQAGELLGVDSHFDASGATGYISSGPPEWERKPFGDRIANIVQANPSVVVIYGSTNDSRYPPEDVAVAARKFWGALHKALPRAKIVAIGPVQPHDDWNLKPLSQVLQKAAAESDVSFVDATSWIRGRGHVGQLRGDGNADIYTSADGVHPTPAGHTYLAQKVAEALRPLVEEAGK